MQGEILTMKKEIRIIEELHEEGFKTETYRDIKFKISNEVLRQYEYNRDSIYRVMQEIALSYLYDKEIKTIEYDLIRAERIDSKFYEMKRNGGLVSRPLINYI